ncbi:hypothetical protein [Dysgonomonas macrotermitis]|uniref:Uncharacterized protein n=1 Tax=Dysgonomonas macrotermitis TaxID=1346286 RepID=A0A1M5IV27_9BACT|nr:hypothetical protein [Dysgonomonas macrotermitis]SHG32116.1 hypothetical protein SAMN05444362_12127 [Dysgonomonas macrotermitis]
MAHQLKVKIFSGNGRDMLQAEINEWLLRETKDGKCLILNILQSESDRNTTISIFYNEYIKE